jgi:hypothetical protein
MIAPVNEVVNKSCFAESGGSEGFTVSHVARHPAAIGVAADVPLKNLNTLFGPKLKEGTKAN